MSGDDHHHAPSTTADGNDHAVERAMAHVAALSLGAAVDDTLRVTLNFHPDRLTATGVPLLARLAEDGVYHSQFVTGTSNGGLTAHPGGDRWRWESRIFGGAYDTEPDTARPVYGALNVRGRSVGGAPRFGSAHLRLTAEAVGRATFCYPDSFYEPSTFGVAAAGSAVVEAALADAVETDPMDGYVEAQVHGPVLLERDVEALVLDPCFRDTEVEARARLLPVPLEWHGGFRLTVAELRRHPDYRGPRFVELGARIAEAGVLDPRVVGDAVRAGADDPQALKKVWHYLAHFGAPQA
ncbi:DUF3626 domain-containing protein [Streptacidiphilus jiangxiensis]|uniref:DUF3626 domain-containing protein n=1 Tax=Streptacidiphilus jiangxiensis TaxID=235985 RepID=A0A1H7QHG2_STRJI|nr:DUF3626 domain-containing protein [Streptacidiphilus jiangxiensis]SEL47531.1 Protein of unknown function [Streptacidiphilus jiangxiensis]